MALDLRQYSCSCKMQHDYRIHVVFGIDHVELGMSPRFNSQSNCVRTCEKISIGIQMSEFQTLHEFEKLPYWRIYKHPIK